MTGSLSSTMAATAGQGILSARGLLVLVLLLVFAGTAFATGHGHGHVEGDHGEGSIPMAMDTLDAEPLAESPCAHASASPAGVGSASGVVRHAGHDASGACGGMVGCAGVCAVACSAAGANVASSNAFAPSAYRRSGAARRAAEEACPSGASETPFRPPIAAPASATS